MLFVFSIHQQYASYSACVRLIQRWVRSQMLDEDYISSLALELVAAHLYLHPAPATAPGSPLSAFLRFLHLFSTHDWNTQPLIVNLNSLLKSKSATRFTALQMVNSAAPH